MIRNENIQYLQNNRELIEAGKNFGCLIDFANLTLHRPERIKEEFEYIFKDPKLHIYAHIINDQI
jgi:hypothetical protein